MLITISGQPGAGSTTVAKLLSKKIRHKLLTVGEIHKKIAKKHNMTIKQYWEMQSKNKSDQEKFHKELDKYQKGIAKKEKNMIINGKLSAFQIPTAKLKILLIAELRERARRTAKRDKIPVGKAMREVGKRERMERKEWKKIYGFDYVKNKSAYDLVINVTKKTPEEIVKIIISKMK